MEPWIPTLLDRFHDAVLVCAPDHRVRYANAALLRAAGDAATRAPVVGADVIAWLGAALGVAEESRALLSRAIDDVIRGERESFEEEIDAITERGRRRLVAHGVRAQLEGEPGVLLELWDFTARWRTERALENRFQLLQTIIDAIPSPIFYKDRGGTYRGCNKAFERYIGIPAERVVGSTVYDVAPKELADKYYQMDNALMQERGVQVYEHGVRYADGSIHEVVFHKATFGGEDGDVAGLVGVMLDITERKRAEQETQRAIEAMQAAVRVKSRFLAVVSHEIRTPLNGVLGMVELLARSDLSSEQRRLVAVARDSAEHLLNLLNNVLDLSKLEADKVDLEMRDFAIDDVVFSVLETMTPTAEAKGVDVWYFIAPEVPGAAHSDPARLRQILLNLVSNAVKFTDHGSVVIAITRAEQPEGGACVRFDVSDTGIGVPEEARGRLFGEFMQADESVTRRYGGTGLGLAITKKLVERMGGEIGFESRPGAGATFWITVPFAEAHDAPAAASSPPLVGVRIRVAALHTRIRELVAWQLSAWGATVTVTGEADDDADEYDVIVVEHRPGQLRAESVVKRGAATTPFIVLAPATEVEALRESMPSNVIVLRKPTSHAVLLAAVARSVGRATPSQKLRSDAPRPPAAQPRALRVLVAEDNYVNQLVVVGMLHALGHSARVVPNGTEALEALEADAFDLVLMDLEMPKMDGIAATQAIRSTSARWGTIPILAVTAHALEGTADRCRAAGMNGCVTKPIRVDRLASAIAACFGAEAPEAHPAARATDVATRKGTLDHARIDALERAIGRDAVRRIHDEFLRALPKYVTELGAALAGDRASGVLPAHALKGAADQIGATALASIARRWESTLRAGELGTLSYDELLSAANDAREALERTRERSSE